MRHSRSMATVSAAFQGIDKTISRSKKKLQKHLRNSGLAYISRTGKLVPAKRVADELCQCPQKCDERVPFEQRDLLFHYFYGLGDADLQNAYLRRHMDVRARANVPEATASGRSPRRISCKYLVPLLPAAAATAEVCQKAFVSAFVISTKRVRLQREKLISSMGLNSYSSQRGLKSPSENKNAALTTSTSTARAECSQTQTQTRRREGARKRLLVDDPLIPLGLVVPEGVTIAPVNATPDHARDIAIVNNFFSNQLWKPEYIGTHS